MRLTTRKGGLYAFGAGAIAYRLDSRIDPRLTVALIDLCSQSLPLAFDDGTQTVLVEFRPSETPTPASETDHRKRCRSCSLRFLFRLLLRTTGHPSAEPGSQPGRHCFGRQGSQEGRRAAKAAGTTI